VKRRWFPKVLFVKLVSKYQKAGLRVYDSMVPIATMPHTDTTAVRRTEQALDRLVTENPGFRDRPVQRQMATAIASTLSGKTLHRHLLVEAPTGSGKTLSYLLGGLSAVRDRGYRLVISTSTVALGEQIIERELPRANLALRMDVQAGIAKGRSRYLCPPRLTQILTHGITTTEDISRKAAVLARAMGDGWDGDRDHYPEPVTDDLWRQVTVEQRSCTGQRCDWFSECPFYRQRARLREAQVVVTNHDLLVMDIDAGGGIHLPSPEKTLYILDEGHHLPERARRGFGRAVRLESAVRMLERLPLAVASVSRATRDKECNLMVGHIIQGAREVHDQLVQLLSDLGNHGPLHVETDDADHRYCLDQDAMPGAFHAQAVNLAASCENLEVALAVLQMRLTTLRDGHKIEPDVAEHLLLATGGPKAVIHRHRELWQMIVDTEDADGERARWIETGHYHDLAGHRVSCSPLDVDRQLRSGLFGRAPGTVLTGATLSRHGDFRALRKELGIDATSAVLRLEAVFDPVRARLSLPAMATKPSDRDAHGKEVARLLPDLINPNESALVLFSSRQEMRDVLGHLPVEYREGILDPDRFPRKQLLACHRERVRQGLGSVIAGVAGLAEGIDLPGDLCQHVIITRLPFPSMSDGLLAARTRRVHERGGNPFMEIVVHETAQRLVHAAGRLLRHEDDTGRITILDRRLVEKGYGKAILRALPHFVGADLPADPPATELCQTPTG